ncbi:hypothetical protein [Ramlibacter sp.]|uniref:hypothetical protein n=1 Tax=Ramlibacter sp. TaxID=1917967 RepID=UPI0026212590|nr:hypothetical protein [Ramlibacter sp.]MDB5954059.1 hypothetical protein [Ramlibacter sp.]
MTPLDLDTLQGLADQAAALHEAVLRGLLQQRWGRAPVLLPQADRGAALAVLARWVTVAPLRDDSDRGALLRARGELRRLVEALGGTLEDLLRAALAGGAPLHPAQVDAQARAKLALLAPAPCALDFDLGAWAQAEPAWAMLFALQALDSHALTAPALAGLRRVLQALPHLPLADLPLVTLPALQRACFLVSYVDSPLRYAAKRRLVEQARHILAGHGLLVDCPPPPARGASRPRLLVIGEGLGAGHAMWRFYAEPLRELRQHFEVTLLGPAEAAPSVTGDLADAFVPFAQTDDPVRAWSRQALDLRPDIVFYPGIGMSFATWSLSLQRLAPLQVAATATPAPSCSPAIDATLLFEDLAPPADLGTIARYDHHVLRPARADLPPATRPDRSDGLACIGVNAVAMKLNDGFLSAIEAVLARAPRPCRLRFLPNLAGAELQAMMGLLLQRFPGAEVLPAMDHPAYLQALAGCDLVLQSFPFGGANTTNDALDLGIPVVALASEFLSGQTDLLLLRERGLESLCARTRDDYVEIALRLLQDAGEARRQLAESTATSFRGRQGRVSMADAILALWQERSAPKPPAA